MRVKLKLAMLAEEGLRILVTTIIIDASAASEVALNVIELDVFAVLVSVTPLQTTLLLALTVTLVGKVRLIVFLDTMGLKMMFHV
jgi:hypothetical protein